MSCETKRFVLISDLHAHPWSAFSIGDGRNNSRLLRTLSVLMASLEHAHQHNIPWVFAGDLVHTAGYALNVVLAELRTTLAAPAYADVEKVAIWGNHDARSIGGKITLDQTVFATLQHAVPNLYMLNSEIRTLRNGLTITGAGYQAHANLLEFGPEADVGVYHQTVRGSVAPNGFIFEEGIDPGELRKRHSFSVVGHIHHPQLIRQGILVPGSPEHHNFGDIGEHGWWDVGIGDGNNQAEFFSGHSPKFLTVDMPEQVLDDGNFYRVRSVPEGARLPDGVVAIAPSPTIVTSRNLLHGVSQTDQVLRVWLGHETPPKGQYDEYMTVGQELLHDQEPTHLRDARVRNIQLHNFCCFADEELTLRDGLWLITGKGKHYPSNGAGKSTLVGEALYWLLFGRTTKGLAADEVVRWGADDCAVRAAIDIDGGVVAEDNQGSTLIVERKRTSSNSSLTIMQDGYDWEATSVTEMTAKLNRYLGITPEIFQNLAYFSQEKLLLFSSATDGERKNVLADLIGLSTYQTASTAAAAQVAAEQDKIIEQRARVDELEERAEAQRSTVEGMQAYCIAWDTQHKQMCQEAELRIHELDQQAEELSGVEAQRLHRLQARVDYTINHYRIRREKERPAIGEKMRADLLRDQAEQLRAAQEQLEQQIERATAGFPSLTVARAAVDSLPERKRLIEERQRQIEHLQEVLTTFTSELAIFEARERELRQALRRGDEEIDEMKTLLNSGVCPTCRQAISSEHGKQCLDPLLQKLATLAGEFDGMVEQHRKIQEMWRATKHELATVKSDLQQLKMLGTTLENTERELHRVTILEQEIRHIKESTASDSIVAQHVTAYIDRLCYEFGNKQLNRQARVKLAITARADKRARASAMATIEREKLLHEENPHITAWEDSKRDLNAVRNKLVIAKKQISMAEAAMAVYEYWHNGFSKQGLQSLMMDEIAALFNNARADIFPLLTQGVYDVQFSTLSTTRKGEVREKTDFYIYERNQLVPYGTLSGGQRRRVDIGIMLVLTQAVARWMGTRGVLGLMILDEVFGFLDASGAEGLVAALGQISEQIETILVVTHDTALQSLIPNTIHVVQNAEGISEVIH